MQIASRALLALALVVPSLAAAQAVDSGATLSALEASPVTITGSIAGDSALAAGELIAGQGHPRALGGGFLVGAAGVVVAASSLDRTYASALDREAVVTGLRDAALSFSYYAVRQAWDASTGSANQSTWGAASFAGLGAVAALGIYDMIHARHALSRTSRARRGNVAIGSRVGACYELTIAASF